MAENSFGWIFGYLRNDIFLLGTLDARMVGELEEKLARLGFAVFPVVLPFAPLHLGQQ